MQSSLECRFWAKVEKTEGCWIWTGARTAKGYGFLNRGRRGEGVIRAHRLSHELNIGPIPDGLLVLHACDNPACIRPEHLFLGTAADNSLDMAQKGRWKNQSRMTPEGVRDIRSRRASGESLRSIANSYEVTVSCICNIAHRRNWTHVQ